MLFSEADLRNSFDSTDLMKGRSYQQHKRVHRLTITSHLAQMQIGSKVQGSRQDPYTTQINIFKQQNKVIIQGQCSCPVRVNCKHVAATLLTVLSQPAGDKALSKNKLDDSSMGTSKKSEVEDTKSPSDLVTEPKPALQSTSSMAIEAGWLEKLSRKTPLGDLKVFEQWLNRLALSTSPTTVLEPQKVPYQLLYILKIVSHERPALSVDLLVAKPLKKGGYGSTIKKFSAFSNTHMRALLPMDHAILSRLEAMSARAGRAYQALYRDHYEYFGEQTELFTEMINTHRCYWQGEIDRLISIESNPLRLGPSKKGQFRWSSNAVGVQRFVCESDGVLVTVLPLTPLWYLEPKSGACGLLLTELEPALAVSLLFAPPLWPQETVQVKACMQKQFELREDAVPLPHDFAVVEAGTVRPRPKLLLFGSQQPYYLMRGHQMKSYEGADLIPLGRLSFIYQGQEIALDVQPNIKVLDETRQVLQNIHRDFSIEKEFVLQLIERGILPFDKRYPQFKSHTIQPQDFLIGEVGDKGSQALFLRTIMPELKNLGWEIVVERSFPAEYFEAIDEWYSTVEESSEYGWFNMELGFVVDQQKINLLPVLVNLIQQYPTEILEEGMTREGNGASSKTIALDLGNGKKVQIPLERIQGILSILTELYDPKSLDPSGRLAVARVRAQQLFGLEKTMDGTPLRWLGSERIQALKERLLNFQSITKVIIPQAFLGTLRDYQKAGVDWLGFLREYELGGILADDMGLGKTVQALAHILIEKQAGRLQKPCLIVVPTSLIGNWKKESQQFTPSLRVLALQGQSRKQLFAQLKEVDLVLTTYALLVRDQDFLIRHEYQMIILDEAQYVKNARTQAYQILDQLKTGHRLCLTGTPIENHLGELWSLFHFLSPGLLGTSKQFTQIFRVPIEKQGNIHRKNLLRQRVSPYILRRTKEEVAKELPEKTEIIHRIQLNDDERDLYEGIRLAMEQKIQSVIHEQGLARSQIVILDALLKLRQTCCDARLLKLSQAKKVKESSKFVFLMQMVSELIAEGRKILLFSSFTSMLKLIEAALQEQSIDYVQLTGSTVDRETPIQRFQSGAVPVFLISLKAGGVGLNLTQADTVIHYDPWWNPAAERQATDRAHRLGQTKPVFVYKLVTVGTVEEKILVMQQKKRSLLEGLFEENATKNTGITIEDLDFLFGPLEALAKA